MAIKQKPVNISDKGKKNLQLLAEKLSNFDDENYYFDMDTYIVTADHLPDRQRHPDEFNCEAPSCALGWAAYWEIAGVKFPLEDFVDYCRRLLDLKDVSYCELHAIHEWIFGGDWSLMHVYEPCEDLQRSQRLAVIDRINFTLATNTILNTREHSMKDLMKFVRQTLEEQ